MVGRILGIRVDKGNIAYNIITNMLIILLLLNNCSCSHVQEKNLAISNQSYKGNITRLSIGRWIPVFLSDFDTTKLQQISYAINEGKVKRIVVSYPTKMQELANQIYDYLEETTNQEVQLRSYHLKDTDQVKYNLTQVIVTLYFN